MNVVALIPVPVLECRLDGARHRQTISRRRQGGVGGSMARIFITGSTDGLGRAAARSLLDQGHEVVLHARSTDRVSALGDLASHAAGVVIGDLRSAVETCRIAEQVNAIGRMDA